MKTVSWILFILAAVGLILGILEALFPFSFAIANLTPGGYLRVSTTLLLFVIALYVLKKV